LNKQVERAAPRLIYVALVVLGVLIVAMVAMTWVRHHELRQLEESGQCQIDASQEESWQQ
jgi:cell division septal protein FtsQ